MNPTRRKGNKELTDDQTRVIKLIQQDVIGRYFDPALDANDFELLSTLRYDPNFTNLCPEVSQKRSDVKIDQIDYRLRDQLFEEAMQDGSGTTFDEFFGLFPKNSSDDNEGSISILSLIDSNYDTQNSSTTIPSVVTYPDGVDLDAIFFQRFFLLGEHYKRLNFALRFFKWNSHIPLKLLLAKLIEALPGHRDVANVQDRKQLLLNDRTCCKMRVLVSKSGKMRIEAHPLSERVQPGQFASSSQYFMKTILSGFLPGCTASWDVFVDSSSTTVSPFTTFKTTYRDHYNESRSRLEQMAKAHGTTGRSEILLYNEAHQLMEGSITNVAVMQTKEGSNHEVRFVTPPLASGCLCGTMRYYLLKKGLIDEHPIDIRNLQEGDTVILFNGVMGAVKGVIKQAIK